MIVNHNNNMNRFSVSTTPIITSKHSLVAYNIKSMQYRFWSSGKNYYKELYKI